MPGSRLILMLLLAACATARPPVPQHQTGMLADVDVPNGEKLLLRTAAKGVQIYTCKAKAADAAEYEWVLKAPEAELFDENSAKIGKHYGGPTWELADGSKVAGEVVKRAAVQGSIPWLLLKAKPNDGAGKLSAVRYIKRTDTSGGVAPATGCDAAHAGAEVRVQYLATYDFYGAP